MSTETQGTVAVAEPAIYVDEAAAGRTPSRPIFILRVLREPVGGASAAVVLLFIAVAAVGPYLAPYSPSAQDLLGRFQPPSPAHWLGTDDLGRDVFTRLIYASRISLLAAIQAVATMLVLAVPIGLLVGYRGGWLDLVIGRIADALLSIPGIVLAISVVSALGPGLTNAMLAVGVSFTPTLFRVVRATTVTVRDETYMDAAIVNGCGTPRILVRHVLPNILSPVLVQITIMTSLAILAEAGLSFLGLGVQPPEASWGVMLSNAFQNVYEDWALMIWPGLCIMVASLAFSLLGDVLRDSLGRGLGGR